MKHHAAADNLGLATKVKSRRHLSAIACNARSVLVASMGFKRD